MSVLKIKIYFLFLLFFTASCVTSESHIQSGADSASDSMAITVKTDTMFAFNTKKISADISNLLANTRNSNLKHIYSLNKNNPFWFDSTAYKQAVVLINSASDNGLNPDKYHLNDIISKKIPLIKSDSINFLQYAELDTLITKSIKLYCNDLLYGVDNHYCFNNNFTDSIIYSLIKTNKILLIPEKFEPDINLYKNLKKGLAKYLLYAKNKDARLQINYPAKAIKKGDTGKIIVLLKRKLSALGYFTDSNKTTVFDKDLETAIKQFQITNGLKPDGIAGRYTFAFINRPPEYYINTIKINMERCRQKRDFESGNGIVINIPEYRLRMFFNDTVVFSSKVIVGKVKKKTPLLKSNVEYLVFNPCWTVPNSIAVKKMLPKLKTDSNYLAKHNMFICNLSGKELNSADIDYSKCSAGNFPYKIFQRHGYNNALGKVKFMFPNKYNIYLHDTPGKYLFNKDFRTFSSGCIRVQNAMSLAKIILQNDNNFTKLSYYLSKGYPEIVKLKKHIPIQTVYFTCNTDSTGRIYFFKDIYGYDKKY
jgi:murein L,D-transpeptidase YcbB/YkuD